MKEKLIPSMVTIGVLGLPFALIAALGSSKLALGLALVALGLIILAAGLWFHLRKAQKTATYQLALHSETQGLASLQVEDFPQAIDEFRKSIELLSMCTMSSDREEQLATTYHNLATALAAEDDLDSALDAYLKAIQLRRSKSMEPQISQQLALSLILRGNILATCQRYMEAIEDFSEAIELEHVADKHRSQALFQRAQSYVVKSQFELAERDYDLANQFDELANGSLCNEIRLGKAMALAANQKFDQSLREFDHAIRNFSDNDSDPTSQVTRQMIENEKKSLVAYLNCA